jgi:hypothetical protein
MVIAIPRIQLRVSDFSGILIGEHFDVRRLLLADSPLASKPERRSRFLQVTSHESPVTSLRGFLWP